MASIVRYSALVIFFIFSVISAYEGARVGGPIPPGALYSPGAVGPGPQGSRGFGPGPQGPRGIGPGPQGPRGFGPGPNIGGRPNVGLGNRGLGQQGGSISIAKSVSITRGGASQASAKSTAGSAGGYGGGSSASSNAASIARGK